MGTNTVHFALKNILDGLIIPGTAGTLQAFITPPDPRDDPPPAIYLWSSRGTEKRQALPRIGADALNPLAAGFKETLHVVEGFLTWFGSDDDVNSDSSFPAVVDAILQALRSSSPMPIVAYDPLTAAGSTLIDIGENMEYEMAPPRATADQRYLRYDAIITIHVVEEFSS